MCHLKTKKMFRALALRPVPQCLADLFLYLYYKFCAIISIILILLSIAHMQTVIFSMAFYADYTSLITSVGLA